MHRRQRTADERADRSGRDPADVDARIRDAYLAEDPRSAWYLDLAEPRVVRVSGGATDVHDLSAQEVEDREERYVEIPAITDGTLHAWLEDFVDERGDPTLAAMLDERQGANRRFLRDLAARDAAAFADWTAYQARRVDEAIAAWRREVE